MLGSMTLPGDLRGPVTVALARSEDSIPPAGSLPGGARYEPKWDGYRVVAVRDGQGVRLWSRQGKDLTGRLPDLAVAARDQLAPGTVLDGEAVIWNGDRLDFDLLQRRLVSARSGLASLAAAHPATFMVFDVLRLLLYAGQGTRRREDPAGGGSMHDERMTIVYGDELASYHFSDEHPLQPSRHQLTMALLRLLGWLDDARITMLKPRPATTSELMTVHSYPYIQAVIHAQSIARGHDIDCTTWRLEREAAQVIYRLPPEAASGEAWPMDRPEVPPEKRPSVTSAQAFPRPRLFRYDVG